MGSNIAKADIKIDWLISALKEGKIALTVVPFAFRTGYRTFKSQCVGRRGEGVSDDDLKRWDYIKPNDGWLNFFILAKPGETEAKQLMLEIDKIVQTDDVSLKSYNPPKKNIVKTIKPQHVADLQAFMDKESERQTKIKELFIALQALNVDVSEMCGLSPDVPKSPPDEWYITSETIDYTSTSYSIGADYKSRIWQLLDQENLIDPAVVDWYKTGKF